MIEHPLQINKNTDEHFKQKYSSALIHKKMTYFHHQLLQMMM